MNTKLRRIAKDTKALSPVVASIILIAVTVAVSIAVAAWMGGMTIGFMGSTSLTITNVDFVAAPTDTDQANMTLTIKNTGTKTVTIAAIRVNGILEDSGNWTNTINPDAVAPDVPEVTNSLDAGEISELIISYDWLQGNPYKVDLYDGSNQVVGSTQQNSPGA